MSKLLEWSSRNLNMLKRPEGRKLERRAILATMLFSVALVSTAQTVKITEYPLPAGLNIPQGITKGPDGALWLTSLTAIGRISTAGVVTNTYSLGSISGVPNDAGSSITAGPDGALWFNVSAWGGMGNLGAIGRITTAGVLTQYYAAENSTFVVGLASGPDGALWFSVTPCSASCHGATGNFIGRLTTAGVLSGSYMLPTIFGSPVGITAGPDGALWFVEEGGNNVGRITTDGVIAEYPIPTANSLPLIIVAGPDGALWFVESSSNKIGRITTSGVITEYAVPTAGSGPVFIAPGPDGALWFVESAANQIGRITTAGVITEYAVPTAKSGLQTIATGPDGALWFTEGAANKIGRVAITGESLSMDYTGPLPAGVAGVPYGPYARLFTATGGTAPYTWSATGLPSGMALSSSGFLSGTPAVSGTFVVTVSFQDSSNPKLKATQELTIVIQSGGPLTILTPSPLPGGTAGTEYSYNLSAIGGWSPYSWSALGDLPAGLSLNASTGLISGTPTAQGPSNFTIQVTDRVSATATLALALSINSAGSGGAGGSTPVRSGVLSQVASGGGWKSSAYIFNPSAAEVSITVNFWADDGTPLNLPLTVTENGGAQSLNATSLSASIAPNATVLIETGSQSGVELSGWAEVLSSAPIQGYGVFHYTSLAGIQSEGTVPLETTFQPSFLMPYDNTNDFQTGLALANLNASAPATVAATIWDEHGSQLAVQTIDLRAGGHASSMLTDLLPATTANRGVIQFRSIPGGNITGLGLRVDPLGGFTSIPKSPSPQ
jgi:streptogramin lyase